MSAAMVLHADVTYPYPQAVLTQTAPGRLTSPPPVPGRPCRHATHMLAADGQAAIFALDGPLRERAPVNHFPSVSLRLRGARPLHATTATTWRSRQGDHLSAYFTEATSRYRPIDLPDPWVPPLTVGVGTGNKKNLSIVGGIIREEGESATMVDLRRQQQQRQQQLLREDASWAEHREEVRKHRERMRQSAQVADLLAPAGLAASAAGDSRSRFWSESARAMNSGGVRRCRTPTSEGGGPPERRPMTALGDAPSHRRVSGNRVLSRMREQYADMPVIF